MTTAQDVHIGRISLRCHSLAMGKLCYDTSRNKDAWVTLKTHQSQETLAVQTNLHSPRLSVNNWIQWKLVIMRSLGPRKLPGILLYQRCLYWGSTVPPQGITPTLIATTLKSEDKMQAIGPILLKINREEHQWAVRKSKLCSKIPNVSSMKLFFSQQLKCSKLPVLYKN